MPVPTPETFRSKPINRDIHHRKRVMTTLQIKNLEVSTGPDSLLRAPHYVHL